MARPRRRRLQRRVFGSGGVRTRVHILTATDAVVTDTMPTFVLVHGLGVASGYFEPLAHRLAEHGSVVIFDLPGFGGMPRPRRALTIAQFAKIVRLVLHELDVRRPVLIGHSMGAQIVVELLAEEPDLSEGAVIIGPVVNADERRLGRLAWRFVQSALYERPRDAALSVRDYAHAGLTWPNLLLPTMLAYPIEERIGLVEASLCLLAGEHDRTAPKEWLDVLAAAAVKSPQVEVAVLPGAAHQVVVGNADEVAGRAVSLAVRRTSP